MVCYLNRGIVIEQAICALLYEYFDSLHLDHKYSNFHVSVTTDHPFADMYYHEGLNAADTFPAVVVTTQEDRKPAELTQLPVHVDAIGIDSSDLAEITKTTETKVINGALKTVEIPGLCTVVDEITLSAIQATIARQGMCYGRSIRVNKKDSIGIEIWAENNQLKNEIYEQVRLFVSANLINRLNDRYPFFGIAIFDSSIVGHRSNNYNFDFDVPLCGSHIALDVNYCVEQIILDTDLNKIETEIILEDSNYVKN